MHKYDGMTVREILRTKKGSIKDAPLPFGSPSWDDILDVEWEEIERRARQRQHGYRTLKKLLTDGEYNK